MKAHRRITRAIRALVVSGCLFAIALPASAAARPIDYHPVSQLTAARIVESNTFHPHGRPAAYSGMRYTLPAGFASDTQSSGKSVAAYSPPAGFRTDTQSSGKPTTTTQTPSVVVREFHTVTSGSDHTLAIVLASCALGIALCGTAYAVVRTSRLQRRAAQSNS